MKLPDRCVKLPDSCGEVCKLLETVLLEQTQLWHVTLDMDTERVTGETRNKDTQTSQQTGDSVQSSLNSHLIYTVTLIKEFYISHA